MIGSYSYSKRQHPTIGFFLGQLEEHFQSRLWPSVVNIAKSNGANIICFPGGPINIDYRYMAQRNVIYKYAKPENLDGLVIMSGVLANFLNTDEIVPFFERFRPLPMVSVALPIEGVPSILVDNAKGIRDVTTHLIEEHDFKRIAFIQGPKNHLEADQRYQAYQDTLEKYGLPFDSKLVAPGNFAFYSGENAIQLLLDERQSQFEAVVAANDRMAMGAMEALSVRGFTIPDDVAVVGFDDIEEVHFTTPPLTTSKQPLTEQANQAVKILLAQIAGEVVPEQISLPTTLVVRQSCGCLNSAAHIEHETPHLLPGIRTELTMLLKAQQTQIVTEIQQNRMSTPKTLGQLDNDWAEKLFETYLDNIGQTDAPQFISTLEKFIQQAAKTDYAISSWQNVITTLRNYSLPGIKNYETLQKLETLWEQARALIAEKAELFQGRAKLKTIEDSLLISEIGQLLLTTFDLDELIKLIDEALPRMKIPGCIIAIYDKEDNSNHQVKIILAHQQNQKFSPGINGKSFLPEQLISNKFLGGDRPRALVVDPLYIQNEQLGLVIFDIGPLNGMIYETLRRQISSSLKGALLLRERKQAENELKKYRDYLIDRTALLKATNEELEAFSYSVSHDLRSPLRSISGFAHILIEDFQASLPADGQMYLERIVKNTQKMDVLIRNLLAFSRLGRQEIHRQSTDCQALAKTVVFELEQETRDRQIKIQIEELPTCQADPILLKQVFFNLISNALKFSRERKTAEIHIGSTEKNNKVVYFVRDNGVGFDMHQAERLFGVFQRLHSADEYEGEGIGLATVKRIITRHGGQTWAESEIGKGSTFFFTVE